MSRDAVPGVGIGFGIKKAPARPSTPASVRLVTVGACGAARIFAVNVLAASLTILLPVTGGVPAAAAVDALLMIGTGWTRACGRISGCRSGVDPPGGQISVGLRLRDRGGPALAIGRNNLGFFSGKIALVQRLRDAADRAIPARLHRDGTAPATGAGRQGMAKVQRKDLRHDCRFHQNDRAR